MGDYWMISDMSGQKFPRSQMRQNYKGMWVHGETEWEPKHPQERIRVKKDVLHRGPKRVGTGDNAD